MKQLKPLQSWTILVLSFAIILLSLGLYSDFISNTKAAPLEQKTAPADFGLSVCRGRVPLHRCKFTLGRNQDVDAGQVETIWTVGGLFVKLTTPQTVTVVSASANDTLLGTGARIVVLLGLDGEGVEQAEVITMTGLVDVASIKEWMFIDATTVISSGTNRFNDGDITTVGGLDLTVQALAPADENISQKSMIMVPKGHEYCITSFFANLNKSVAAATATFSTIVDVPGLPPFNAGFVGLDTASNSAFNIHLSNPQCIPELSLVQSVVEANDNNIDVTGSISGYLICVEACNK